MTNLLGNDISSWQGDVDFSKLKSKSSFVILRAGFGGYRTPAACKDIRLDEYIAGCENTALPYGLYWFGNYQTFPELQAEWFSQVANSRWGQLQPVLDFEWYWTPYISQAKSLVWIKTFMERVDQLSGRETMFYCNPGMLRFLKPIGKDYPEWFTRRLLWIAHYINASAPTTYGVEWDVWQFSDRGPGKEFGVSSAQIDMNWLNGPDLARIGYKKEEPPAPELTDKEKLDTLWAWYQKQIQK